MMKYKSRKAFTILELVFVIVVIGILSAVAIPKFAATRDDAVITKARTTVAAIRSALATERQKRILRGDFNSTLSNPASSSKVFIMNMGNTETELLEYGIQKCPSSNKKNCWERGSTVGEFKFYGPNGNSCIFSISAGRLNRGACSVSGLTNL